MVVGAPSSALGAAMAKAETARLAAQKAALGPEKLAALGAALAEATRQNDTPFPEQMLRQFPVPSVENVATHRVAALRSALAPAAKGERPLPPPPAGALIDVLLLPAHPALSLLLSRFDTAELCLRTSLPRAELEADAALVSSLGVAAQFDEVQSAFVEVSHSGGQANGHNRGSQKR